jgi:hypothetical protein
MDMLRMSCVVAALLLAAPTLAADWQYDGGATPIAYVDNGKAQFQFACRGGDLAMGYWVRAPHKRVAGAASMNVAITPDDGGTSFAQDMPLIHSDGSSMIVRGPVARQWARIAQGAKAGMRVAYAHKGAGGLEFFDSNAFGAEGSAAAIKRVLEQCG